MFTYLPAAAATTAPTARVGVESSPVPFLSQADEAPLHVSLAAILVIALLVCWDRRRHGGHRLKSR